MMDPQTQIMITSQTQEQLPTSTQPPLPPSPQPFEIALVRKLESKTTSVRDAFLLLDIDGDGHISPTDIRTVLHNEPGLDLTTEQEHVLFSRYSPVQQKQHHLSCNKDENHTNGNTSASKVGMGYADFAKYYSEVSKATFPASQSGLAAAVGFHRDDEKRNNDNDTTTTDHEMPIYLHPQTVIHQRRHQLRQLLTAHSSRESSGNSGMKETSLFLKIDVHRSGKVTMEEFLEWVNGAGTLDWAMDDLKQVVLNKETTTKSSCDGNGGGILDSEKLLEQKWFGTNALGDGINGKKDEAGMTEHDFARFVESLDDE